MSKKTKHGRGLKFHTMLMHPEINRYSTGMIPKVALCWEWRLSMSWTNRTLIKTVRCGWNTASVSGRRDAFTFISIFSTLTNKHQRQHGQRPHSPNREKQKQNKEKPQNCKWSPTLSRNDDRWRKTCIKPPTACRGHAGAGRRSMLPHATLTYATVSSPSSSHLINFTYHISDCVPRHKTSEKHIWCVCDG